MEQNFMNDAERERCVAWINQYLSEYPRKTADSYCLKHLFQKMTGIYASEAEFQAVLRECGFEPLENHDSLFSLKVDRVVIENVYYHR